MHGACTAEASLLPQHVSSRDKLRKTYQLSSSSAISQHSLLDKICGPAMSLFHRPLHWTRPLSQCQASLILQPPFFFDPLLPSLGSRCQPVSSPCLFLLHYCSPSLELSTGLSSESSPTHWGWWNLQNKKGHPFMFRLSQDVWDQNGYEPGKVQDWLGCSLCPPVAG